MKEQSVTQQSSKAANESALIRGMMAAKIPKSTAEAYEKEGALACGIREDYPFLKLIKVLSSDDSMQEAFFDHLDKQMEVNESIVDFFYAYLGLSEEDLDNEEKYDDDLEALFGSEGTDLVDEKETILNPFQGDSYSIVELSEKLGKGLFKEEVLDKAKMDIEENEEQHEEKQKEKPEGLLYVYDAPLKRIKLKNPTTMEIPYIEVPEEDCGLLKRDFETATHLKPLENVINTLRENGKAILSIGSRHTGFVALRYIAAEFAREGECVINEPFSDHKNISFEDKLMIVDAKELTHWYNDEQFKNVNSGMFRSRVNVKKSHVEPPWELIQDIPLAIVLEKHHYLGSNLLNEVEDLLSSHGPIIFLYIRNEEAENSDSDAFTVDDGRALIVDDLSFQFDFDIYHIEEPSIESHYYQMILKSIASSLGYELDEDLNIEDLLLKLNKIRKHRWDGNTTIAQMMNRAVSVKKEKDNVFRKEDFEFLDQSIFSRKLKQISNQSQNNEDAIKRMNNELLGLETVKKDILKAVSTLEMQKLRQKEGLKSLPMHNTFVFQGAPGTGKTEMAKHLTNIMTEKGLLSNEGDFALISGNDLRGQYVGSTAPKIQALFENNSAIFIDEAYSIVANHNGTDIFSQEAMAELCIQLERWSDQKLIIFGGYASKKHDEHNKMREFLEDNPGINSRISYYINFPDYEPHELIPIVKGLAEKNNYTLEEGFEKISVDLFQQRYNTKSFGNAREARRFFEMAAAQQAARLMKENSSDLTLEQMKEIKIQDFKEAAQTILESQITVEEKPKRTIGFTSHHDKN